MKSAYDVLDERGLVADVTDIDTVRKLLAGPPVTFYVGFDPTADSLHVGHLLPILVMAHLQRAGHRPIALVGGGTGMVGDPSGKTELRNMLSEADIARNLEAQKVQLRQFLEFDGGKPSEAKMMNNADWLAPLNYITFLREIGVHFTVNRMLTAESFKQRWEKGLTFIEFNYMLLQAYDFLTLAQRENCRLQIGGSDQWGNICAGVDLTRRVEGKEVFGLTVPLLLTSDGRKFGKTEKGALWLAPQKTSPHDFYQYWRNIDDKDVEKCLRMLTFLPIDEVKRLADVEPGPALNGAKKRLAFELTKLVHGEGEAKRAEADAAALFAGADAGSADGIPTLNLDKAKLEAGIALVDAMVELKLAETKSAARRLIQQGGAYVNQAQENAVDRVITAADLQAGQIVLRAGKKKHGRIVSG